MQFHLLAQITTTTADLDHSVAEHFWFICLLGTASVTSGS